MTHQICQIKTTFKSNEKSVTSPQIHASFRWIKSYRFIHTARDRDRYREWDWHSRRQWDRFLCLSWTSVNISMLLGPILVPFPVPAPVPVPCSVNKPNLRNQIQSDILAIASLVNCCKNSGRVQFSNRRQSCMDICLIASATLSLTLKKNENN